MAAEVNVWGMGDPSHPLAGRADAVVIKGGRLIEVIDWKSDRDPPTHKDAHLEQLSDYVQICGAERGAVVYMTTGEIITVNRDELAGCEKTS